MFRRLFLITLRRSILIFLLICMGCSAQSVYPETQQSINRQIRAYYNIPSEVKIVLGPLKPSELSNYDSVSITMDGGTIKREYNFLLSQDKKTLIRVTKLDLTKDPYAEVMQKIYLKGRPVRGNNDAKVIVANYDDFECPYCAGMHQTLF